MEALGLTDAAETVTDTATDIGTSVADTASDLGTTVTETATETATNIGTGVADTARNGDRRSFERNGRTGRSQRTRGTGVHAGCLPGTSRSCFG